MIKKSFSDIGIFFLNFLSLLPFPVLYFLSTLSYYPVYYIVRYRRKVVRQNLLHSFPEKSISEIIHIEKIFYKYFCDLSFEIIKMQSISREELDRRVRFNNLAEVEKYYQSGKNVLACSSHYCNWEWGMLALSQKLSATPYVIYKPLNDKAYENWFNQMRVKFGNVFIPMKQTLRALVDTKNKATMFCFAGDQTPVKHEAKYWIQFLHQPTAVLLGLEKIALKTDRPVIYFNMKPLSRGYYEIDCHVICEKPSASQGHQISNSTFAFLESIINDNPPYWLWTHRRWKHKPTSEEWNQA